MPEHLSGMPAGWLAQRILAEASADPSLISRQSVAPVVRAPAVEPAQPSGSPFPTMALLSDPALDIRQYLEDLVTIAVSSAQQAEEVSSQAREASRKARRGMIALASFGALGLLIGAAGFAASRSSNVKLSEVRQEMGALQDLQRQTNEQLAVIAAKPVDSHGGVEAAKLEDLVPAEPSRAQPVPLPPATMPPITQPQIRYTTPWPEPRPAVHRVAPARGSSQVVLPQFVVGIQRNLRAIFR